MTLVGDTRVDGVVAELVGAESALSDALERLHRATNTLGGVARTPSERPVYVVVQGYYDTPIGAFVGADAAAALLKSLDRDMEHVDDDGVVTPVPDARIWEFVGPISREVSTIRVIRDGWLEFER